MGDPQKFSPRGGSDAAYCSLCCMCFGNNWFGEVDTISTEMVMKITFKTLPRVTAGMVMDAVHSYVKIWRWLKRCVGAPLGLHSHRWGSWVSYSTTGWGSMNSRYCKACGATDRSWSPEDETP